MAKTKQRSIPPIEELKSRKIGRILTKMGVVNRNQVSEALEHQKQRRMPLGELLIDLGYASQEDVSMAMAAQAGMVEGLVAAMETKGQEVGTYFVPDRHTLYAAQVLTQELYPSMVTAIRGLAGGARIALPSAIADFANDELRTLIDRTQQSAATNALDKVKFYKLAWDATGSEYGSRHTQYEMFYAGATFVTKGHSFRCYDWERATGLVDELLDSYNLEDELDGPKTGGSTS